MVIIASIMLTYCWLKFVDVPLFTVCVAICIQTSKVQHVCTQDTLIDATGTSGSKISMLDDCIRITTHIVNSDISTNFNQEFVNITLAIVSILLHL